MGAHFSLGMLLTQLCQKLREKWIRSVILFLNEVSDVQELLWERRGWHLRICLLHLGVRKDV